MKVPPSRYFRRHVYVCVFDDPHGLRSLDEIGVDRVTYETDYPHSDSTWPDSRRIAEEQTHGLSSDAIEAIMRGNATACSGWVLNVEHQRVDSRGTALERSLM